MGCFIHGTMGSFMHLLIQIHEIHCFVLTACLNLTISRESSLYQLSDLVCYLACVG